MLTPPFHFAIPACPPISPSGPFNNIASPSDGCSGPVINLSLEDDPPSRPASSCILYRGAIPAARNIPFIRRLRIKTVVALTPFLPDKCPLSRWAQKDGADVRWVKADKMGEEKLGMGKSEVSEVLKMMLDTSLYPLYLADVDGRSHTTLLVACLRKLQGWHMESIIREVERFEPEHEDLPLHTFISSYLTGPSSEPLTLPPPPYPSWLWPVPVTSNPNPSPNLNSTGSGGIGSGLPGPSSTGSNASGPGSTTSSVGGLSRHATLRENDIGSPTTVSTPITPTAASSRDNERRRDKSDSTASTTGPPSVIARDDKPERDRDRDRERRGDGERELTGRTRERDRERDRTVSAGTSSSTTEGILPFPHPAQSRRHPTMKLTFPLPPAQPTVVPPMAPLSRQNSKWGDRDRERDRDRDGSKSRTKEKDKDKERDRTRDATSPDDASTQAQITARQSALSSPTSPTPTSPNVLSPSGLLSPQLAEQPSLLAAASSIVAAGLHTIGRVISPSDSDEVPDRTTNSGTQLDGGGGSGAGGSTTGSAGRSTTSSPRRPTQGLGSAMSLGRDGSEVSRSTSRSTAEDFDKYSPVGSGFDPGYSFPSVPPPQRDSAPAPHDTAVDGPTVISIDTQPKPSRVVSFRRESSTSAPSSPSMRDATKLPPLPISIPAPVTETSLATAGSGDDHQLRNTLAAIVSSTDANGSGKTDGLVHNAASPSQKSVEDDDVEGRGNDEIEEGDTEERYGRRCSVGDDEDEDEDDEYYEDEDEDDEDEEEEEEDEDDEDTDALAPTALHISALDLAGYG